MSFWDFLSGTTSDSAEKNRQAGYSWYPWKADNSPSSDWHYWEGVRQRQDEINRRQEEDRRWQEAERRRTGSW